MCFRINLGCTPDRPISLSFQELLDYEATHQANEMDHPDHLEGAAAFLEKRKAEYR